MFEIEYITLLISISDTYSELLNQLKQHICMFACTLVLTLPRELIYPAWAVLTVG